MAYMKKGQYNSALTDLWQATKLSGTPKRYKLLATCNQELRKINEAEENYKRALKAAEERPNDKANQTEKAMIYLERGQLYSKQGNYKLAIEDFNKAIKMKIEKGPLPALYLERGRCHRHDGNYKQSIEDLLEAVSRNSKKQDNEAAALSYNDLGLSYYECGMWEDVIFRLSF